MLWKWPSGSGLQIPLKTKWGFDLTLESEAHGCVLKVLSLVWRTETDVIFKLKHLMDIFKEKNTKRCVLHSLHSHKICDPMGFLIPFTIRLRCLFQDIWQRGLGWDEELPDDLTLRWQQWCTELPQIHQIVIPRWYGAIKVQNEQSQVLHIFSDATEKAYGAVAYIPGQTADGEPVTRLVMSKSRVAPIKELTLPWLELIGTLIAARLGNSLLKPLNSHPVSACIRIPW